MKVFKYLLLAIGLTALLSNPAKALTSSYDKNSQILVIEGVNLDQDLSISESDLSEIITDRANSIDDDAKAFQVRFFFSPSVESQIRNQIKANQDNDGARPTLEILKNNDLRTTRTRVKLATVETKKKSYGFLNYINPDSAVKLAISTEYTFDLHDFSKVDDDESVGFEFEISTARTFSGNIDFKVSLNAIETGSNTGGSSVDNGSGGGGSSSGGSTDVANPAINSDIDAVVADITTKLADSYDAVNKTVVCGSAEADEVDVCDSDSLSDFKNELQDAKSDLNSLETDNAELKQIINTARKDSLLSKKEANQIKDALDSNTKKANSAKKEINDIINKINKKTNQGKTFTGSKEQQKLQAQLNSAKNKLSQAHSDLKNKVLRPLLDKNIISQEVYDKYNVGIDEVNADNSSTGGSTTAGESVTTVSTSFPDGSTLVTDADGSTTRTFPDGTVVTETTNADGSISRTTTNPDGTITTSKVVTNADGSTTETITNPDGSISIARSVTNEDGSVTTTTTNPDGTTSSKTVVRNADGSTTTTYDDGTIEIKRPDGSVSISVTNADGSVTTTTTNADGSTTVERSQVNADGSISTVVTNPDGTTTIKRAVTNEDGSVTTTITHPDGSITTETAVTNEDGSVTTAITNADGTTTIKTAVTNADGSVTTTTLNPDGSITVSTRNPDGSVTVTNADGSTTTTKLDGTEITKTQNADGSFTVVTTNPDGTTTTATEVVNADGSVTTTITNTDGSTTVSTAVTNADGSVTTTTTVTSPNTDGGNTDGDGGTISASITSSLASVIEDYSNNIADSFNTINVDYTCNSETGIDICDVDDLIAFQAMLIESKAKLRTVELNNTKTLRQTVNSALKAKLISKKRAKLLKTRINRNNVRVRKARKSLLQLKRRIRARVDRGRSFSSVKANNYFQKTINQAKLRINRSYVKLQEVVVRPLFNINLVSEEVRAQYDVSITELN